MDTFGMHAKRLGSALGFLYGLASLSCAQSYPPAWSSAASYAIGDQVQLNGNVLRAVRAVSPGGFKYASWELWDVRANTTLLVGTGAPFQTLNSAWNYALNCRVAQGVSLHFELLSGHTENIASTIFLDHPSGARMSIIGMGPTTPVLNFTSVGTGFALGTGAHSIADIENLQMTAPAGGSNAGPAFEVEDGCVLAKVTNLSITNFDIAFKADTGGTINLISGITLNQFQIGGAEANSNSTIQFVGQVTFDGSNTVGTVPQFGFDATTGGTIICPSCTANNCLYDFEATRSGVIDADSSSSTSPAANAYQYGYFAGDAGRIYANMSLATGSEQGYIASYGGFIAAENSQATGYGGYGYNASRGGIIDASNSSGGTSLTQPGDGSYVY